MSKAASLMVMLACFMMWVPLGQHTFLIEHWMKVGTFMLPFLICIAFAFKPEPELLSDARFFALISLAAYILHQFEEHWIDLYGRVYSFHPYINNFLAEVTGGDGSAEFMSRSAVFVINTSLVWLVGALGISRGEDHIFAVLCMVAIAFVNAFSHIAAGAINASYNPGLLTSVVIFVPLSLYIYASLFRNGTSSLRLILYSIVWALMAHVIMIGGIIAVNRFSQVPELAYFVALVIWSVLPSVLFPRPDEPTPSETATNR